MEWRLQGNDERQGGSAEAPIDAESQSHRAAGSVPRSVDDARDRRFMLRALELARLGRYTTGSNPAVGAVLVQGDAIVGEGTHWLPGTPHAEVHALRNAGERACGATLYVTLEPCSHYGRTPPCADALIAARVGRVVAAMTDPNPQVAGRGLARLRDAGVDVRVGVLEADARALNPGFLSRMERGRPFVRVKLAMSLDGRTALADGSSAWITDAAARADVQAWRARAQAVVTGSGTVLADDPRLDVRRGLADLLHADGIDLAQDSVRAGLPPALNPDGLPPQPLRVVLDRRGRCSPVQQILREIDAARPVLWVAPVSVAAMAPGDAVEIVDAGSLPARLECPDTDEEPNPGSDADPFLEAVLQRLAQRGVNLVHVEAGAALAAAWLRSGLVDEWLIYQAPVLLGAAGRPLIDSVVESMNDRHRFEVVETRVVGSSLRWRGRILPDA